MAVEKKNFGIGSLSLPLVLLSLIFGTTTGGKFFRLIGNKVWSNENFGVNYTGIFSIILLILGFFLGRRFEVHWGAKLGGTVANIMVCIIAISMIIQMFFK
ncbi:MAG: hypothetical protein FH761_08810 [Firmicutes bacterium]|nr:hypothetical protein [Bacillota bacterium]